MPAFLLYVHAQLNSHKLPAINIMRHPLILTYFRVDTRVVRSGVLVCALKKQSKGGGDQTILKRIQHLNIDFLTSKVVVNHHFFRPYPY